MANERWLITGASGQLGGHVLRRVVGDRPAAVLALAGGGDVGVPGVEVHRIDLRQADALRSAVAAFRPTHIVHTAAMTAVSDAFARPAEAEAINVRATGALADAAAACGSRLVFTSTDMVFDGCAAPYREGDQPTPLSHYGRTKATAERLLADVPGALVARIPLLYGFPITSRSTTFAQQITALRAGQPLRLFTDEFRTPAWSVDAAAALVALARSERTGLIHVAGPERLSRFEIVARFARLLGLDETKLEPISRLAIGGPEPRPADLSLDGSRFRREFEAVTPGPIRAEVLQPQQ